MFTVDCIVLVSTDDIVFFFLMIRRPPRSTQSRSSAASDVYKRQNEQYAAHQISYGTYLGEVAAVAEDMRKVSVGNQYLSLIHISEPTRPY